MRCFVAIDLPDAVCERLEDLQAGIPVGRALAPETFHLTLAFLGALDPYELDELNLALGKIRMPPFSVQLKGLGVFGSRSPSALWAGVAPIPALGRLHRKVNSAARMAGIELKRVRFRPHVTLARFPSRMDADSLERLRQYLERFAASPMPEVAVEEITLFRSHLRPEGALHEPLAVYPLGAAP